MTKKVADCRVLFRLSRSVRISQNPKEQQNGSHWLLASWVDARLFRSPDYFIAFSSSKRSKGLKTTTTESSGMIPIVYRDIPSILLPV